jgi:hypothetical protein
MEGNFKCNFPGCHCNANHRHTLELVNESEAYVEMPFCDYHFFIVIGGHFKARILPATQNLLGECKEKDFEILGPFKEVEIAEQVLGAKEMVFKLKSENK